MTEIAAARWRLRRCWSMETSLFDMEIAKQREDPQFEPQDYEAQHATAARVSARICASWIATRPVCAAATNALSKISTSSAPAEIKNFQTNPRIPPNNPQP